MSSLAGAEQTPRKILDFFLLREPERVVLARGVSQQETVARYHAAALRRIQIARELHEASEAVAAITLYREASILLIAALLQGSQSESVEPASSSVEAWAAFDSYRLPATHAKAPETLASTRELLSRPDILAADALSPGELSSKTAAAAEVVDWLASAVEPRTVRDIRLTRTLRLIGAVLLIAYIIYKLVGLRAGPKDLALNKPAFASSQRPGTPVAAGVDNGEIERTFGVHTNVEANPWVQIDLGAPVAIHEVRVYNRGDGFQTEMVPLILQVSDDGHTFSDIERRDVQFTQDDPWVVTVDGRLTRYVRVYMPRNGYIALSEIQVY